MRLDGRIEPSFERIAVDLTKGWGEFAPPADFDRRYGNEVSDLDS